MDAGYTLLDHTADAGLVAWGPDPAAAFGEAARGMFTIALGCDPAEWAGHGRSECLYLEVEATDWPTLLVNWLAELVFHFDVDGFVPKRIDFEECMPTRCAATVEGVYLDDAEQPGGVGIKAVTYHQLAVDVGPGRTDVRVIFDI